jgi:outer membrane protein assembly factor BamE (lipoprotein component of BamABCDE complex)
MKRITILLAGVVLCVSGCASSYGTKQGAAKESALTSGMTKKFIYSGKTTQTEVLEIFGPPDLVTRKSGTEVWTYDKISQDISSSGGFVTILIAGYSKQSAHSRNTSTMLIIYFDKNEVVEDYKLSVSKF